MKKIILTACVFAFASVQAQVKPKFEKAGELVKVSYFYDNGKIKERGFFKDKKLHGTWFSFDKEGNKIAIAHFKNGKKVGKWLMWYKDGLREIDYQNNSVASVQVWKESTKIALK
ncbi:MAG: toxin-antitoxin system YwqK family antitoxin [Tenacibaculum sp.]